MRFDPTKPYNQLPDLPPREQVETPAVLKRCIAARAALAELKGLCESIPNPDVLIRCIGLQEARASSEIENVLTTTDEMYRALANSITATDVATKEVLRYYEAMNTAMHHLQKRAILSTNLFCEIASKIKQSDMAIRKLPGTRIVSGAGRTIYTPPEGEEVIRLKLANFEHFINTQSAMDPLVKLAIMHYQFEAIHPFIDGNGRTGRILNILYLVQQGLLDFPILYLSQFFIERRSEYYGGLRGITENKKWEPWILYVLEGIELTAQNTKNKVVSIRKSMDTIYEQLKRSTKKYATKDLVELLYYQPYCKIKFLQEHFRVTRQTAATYLHEMEDMGILSCVKLGSETYYINKALLNILRLMKNLID
jgi:Fic family protein